MKPTPVFTCLPENPFRIPMRIFFPISKHHFRFKFGRRKDNLVGTAGLGNDALELIDLLLGTAKGTELLMLLV
jgi:hypothetical protein